MTTLDDNRNPERTNGIWRFITFKFDRWASRYKHSLYNLSLTPILKFFYYISYTTYIQCTFAGTIDSAVLYRQIIFAFPTDCWPPTQTSTLLIFSAATTLSPFFSDNNRRHFYLWLEVFKQVGIYRTLPLFFPGDQFVSLHTHQNYASSNQKEIMQLAYRAQSEAPPSCTRQLNQYSTEEINWGRPSHICMLKSCCAA